jgi:hypothetical protein
MAIYLDTNVLRGWRTLAAAERLAVDILAAELGLEIVVPSLVAAEIEGHWRREFEAAADSFYASARKVEVLFDLGADNDGASPQCRSNAGRTATRAN